VGKTYLATLYLKDCLNKPEDLCWDTGSGAQRKDPQVITLATMVALHLFTLK